MNLKKLGAITMTAALILSLTGCIRITSDVTLHEDNTASGEIVVAIQEGVGESLGMTDAEWVASMNEDNGTNTMVDATVSEYKEDGYVGNRVSFKDEPIDSFKGVDGSLVREGDDFVFTGNEIEQTQTLPEGSGAIATMSITFPGKVSKHNGALEGNTVTWDLLTQTEAPYATGSAIGGGGGSSSIILIAIIVGGIVLAAAIIGGIVLSRRKGSAPPSNEEAPPAVEPAP
jgi:hypothetical protein